MKSIINLDEDFRPFEENFKEIEFQKFSFPSGSEPHIKIDIKPWMKSEESVIITTRIKSSEDIIVLLLATDALRNIGYNDIKLFIPFLPLARQDRVM